MSALIAWHLEEWLDASGRTDTNGPSAGAAGGGKLRPIDCSATRSAWIVVDVLVNRALERGATPVLGTKGPHPPKLAVGLLRRSAATFGEAVGWTNRMS